jgi:hypothetical protein
LKVSVLDPFVPGEVESRIDDGAVIVTVRAVGAPTSKYPYVVVCI